MPNFSTKADIRAEFLANPTKYAGLSEKEQHSIVSRGQVAAKAIAVYNRGRKAHRRYVPGQGQTVKAQKAQVRADLVSRGLAGKRGPLSKAAQSALKAK